MNSDESVKLQELSLELHTNLPEMKRLLSLLKLLNKAFSTKSTQYIHCTYDEKLNGTLFSTYKTGSYVAASAAIDTHTHLLTYT